MINPTLQIGTSSLPQEAYEKFRGKWIALSLDGSKILASDDDLGRLEDQLITAGIALDAVRFDLVEDEDISLGGVELL